MEINAKILKSFTIDIIDKIILDILAADGTYWWRYAIETSMCEAHKMEIKYLGLHEYYLKCTCNCNSHSRDEAHEPDCIDMICTSYYELREKIQEFAEKHDFDLRFNYK